MRSKRIASLVIALLASTLSTGKPAARTAAPSAPCTILPPTPDLPGPDKQGRVDVAEAKIWYGIYDTANARGTVVLLHGGLGNAAYFGHLIPYLTSRHYRVVAIDSRGQGRSTGVDTAISYHRLAEDVVAVIAALNLGKVDIVGWSDGGVAGLDLAVHHPLALRRLYIFGANMNQAGLKRGYAASPIFSSYMTRTRAEYAGLSPGRVPFDRLEGALEPMWSREPNFSLEDLASISVPVMVADGSEEEVISEDNNILIVKSISGARKLVIQGCGHFTILQKPSSFNASVADFLSDG